MKFQGEERALGILETEDDGVRVGRLHRLHGPVLLLAARGHVGGGEDDLVVGGLHVLGGHEAAVVELDPVTQLEGVGALVRGDRPRLGEIADDLGSRLVGGIHAQQRVVVRAHGMEHAERFFPVAVEARGLGRAHEDQLSAVPRLVLGVGGTDRGEQAGDGEAGQDQP